ncbi:MAG: hypothetical protein DDT27_01481 [Dehalococcoidia bacterium]|nr:hypothetical protein [Chloroflexota bacterium]
MLRPWNAAALSEIMAGAVQESKRRVHGGGQTGEQQASNREALPEPEEVKQQEPERGLTLRLTGLRGFLLRSG